MLERKTDTPESVAFWDRVERVKAGINEWPEWKRRMLAANPPLRRPTNGDDEPRDARRGERD